MNEFPARQAIDIKQLAEATGLSESTLRRRVKDGSLPVIQLGGARKKLLFSRSVIGDLAEVRNPQLKSTATHRPTTDAEGDPMTAASVAGSRPANSGTPESQSDLDSGVKVPKSGRIPRWMRHPLINKRDTSQGNNRASCQEKDRTN